MSLIHLNIQQKAPLILTYLKRRSDVFSIVIVFMHCKSPKCSYDFFVSCYTIESPLS
uniref:Uncharacterized protein n=1 Tax=Arundo donax TaxID=35708 RepID=A0A0A9HDH7_ARUDO